MLRLTNEARVHQNRTLRGDTTVSCRTPAHAAVPRVRRLLQSYLKRVLLALDDYALQRAWETLRASAFRGGLYRRMRCRRG